MLKIIMFILFTMAFSLCFSQFDKVHLSTKPGKNEFNFNTYNFHLSNQNIKSFVTPPLNVSLPAIPLVIKIH